MLEDLRAREDQDIKHLAFVTILHKNVLRLKKTFQI